ncbi:cytochrome d ubiquinol oxidase subunit II [Natranaeroarchaeum sulfidigenes]|uniref:Cytochrome bd-type quinol oxidase, subunit 2 n=1 Tax=Natranaeroarchaeum sulfidigenes TaxID=2784880 RepID=A0A897MMG7_9EURY|nr:cytochrome d ubiquinol oxidase subunit II [Natranaeroarchaeum sulfidigenes]QSG01777.1 Cytochrome bd-type quinol oxidase, subunit 2 [Natranaeroarchaeum sulfidigenes]
MTPLFVSLDEYLIGSLPELWFAVVMLALGLYVFLDGFDFGIGMLYATCETEAERDTLMAAFGPIWKANEVWLVGFGTFLIAAFPPVYARLLSEHYLLAVAILFALIARGVAPKLRDEREDATWQETCDRSFIIGSFVSPLLLGTLVGSWVFGTGSLSLPAVLTGVVVVALSLSTGAALLGLKTDGALRHRMARYGQGAVISYLGAVVLLLTVAVVLDAGAIRSVVASPSGIAIVLATIGLTIASVLFAERGADGAWFASTAGLALALLAVVVSLLYPTVYPAAEITVRDAVVSPIPLNVSTIVGLPVLVLVLGYFAYLYSVFSGPVDENTFKGGY